MKARNPLVYPWTQALVLVVVSSVIAVVVNLAAAPTRKLKLPAGFYPDALRVPPREPVRVPPPARTETTPVTTTTVAPVATDTTVTVAPVVTATTTVAPVTATAAEAGGLKPAAPPVTATTTTSAPAAPAVDPLTRFRPHPDKAYIEISGEDAALLYSKGVLFLDARRTAAYEESHIAGARPFSVWEADVDAKVNALYEERQDAQDQPIVIYCTGGACEDSHMLSQKLWGIQFNNVYVYKDGFPDWQKRGGAVRAGAQP